MSRSKRQGTKFESYIVDLATDIGVYARRLAEGGIRDMGDVEIVDQTGGRWTIEAKACERLSLHHVWRKTAAKAPLDSLPVVAWKRVTLKDGNSRRSADGPPLVAVPLPVFLRLLRDRSVGEGVDDG